jgi:hypothetical protein
MSLLALKTAAYDILQIASPSAADDVTLLMCFNHARLQAERKHDFELSKGTAYLTVDSENGATIASAQASFANSAPTGATVATKTIRRGTQIRNSDDDGWVDAEVMSFDKYHSLVNRAQRETPWDVLSAAQDPEQVVDVFDTRNVLYIDGPTIYTTSDTDVVAKLRIYKYLDSYASFNASADFLITYCPDYLLWASIVQFNHKKGVYLPRNEGSIDPSSPLGMMNAAWEAAVVWDRYMVEGGTYIIAE